MESQQADVRKSHENKKNKMASKRERLLQTLDEIDMSTFSRRSELLSVDITRNVIKQLGYLPYNLVEVAAVSENDCLHPLVLKLYPLNTNDLKGRYARSVGQPLPFPTMMWMSCPLLQARISELEVAGWIEVFQKRLTDSEIYQENMREAHKQYAMERWNMLSPEEVEVVEKNGW